MKKKTMMGKLSSLLFALALVWGGVSCTPPQAPVDPTKYTITFDSNGGSEVAAQEVAENVAATAPEAPTKDGYTFVEWLNAETAYDWTAPVTGNLTLTAKWVPVEYKITYLPEDVETDNPTTYTIETETFALADPKNVPDATKPNFVAWHVDSEEGDVVTEIAKGTTGDLTIVAEFSAKTVYVVTYYIGETKKTQNVVEGNAFTLTGYNLFTDKEFKTAYTAKEVTANIELYAQAKTYTVTFDSDGGSEVAAIPVEYNKTITEPTAPTKEGCVFDGWYDGETKFDWSKPVTKNVTLKAKWITKSKYTISFKSTGGNEVTSIQAEEGTIATKPDDPKRDGFIFLGWYNGTDFFKWEETKITSNVELTAHWKEVAAVIETPEPLVIEAPEFSKIWGCTVEGNVISYNAQYGEAQWTCEDILDYDIIDIYYENQTEKNQLCIKSSSGTEQGDRKDLLVDNRYPELSVGEGKLTYYISDFVAANENFKYVDLATCNTNENSVTITKIVLTKVVKLEDKVIFDPATTEFVPGKGTEYEIVEKDGVKFLKVIPQEYGTEFHLISALDLTGYTHCKVQIYNDETSDKWKFDVGLRDYTGTSKEQAVGDMANDASADVIEAEGAVKGSLVSVIQPFTQSKENWSALKDKAMYIGKITAITK